MSILRTIRRWLAGTTLVLVASAWLSVAAAPCIAVMDYSLPDTQAGTVHADTHAMHACPHCDQAAAPCMDKATDCVLPDSLVPPVFKFQPALFPAGYVLPPMAPRRVEYIINLAAGPPPPGPPLTTLYCSFQE